MSYQAIIVGGTGAVGQALVRELIDSPLCLRVTALVRRAFDGFGADPDGKVQVEVIDLAKLERATRSAAQGCQVAFCTMGIGQPRKVSLEEFRRVDVEYAGAFARGAYAAGINHISLLSSVGANRSSRNRYLVVKGDSEYAVTSAGVARSSMFRPSLLVTQATRYGLQDVLTQAFFPLISPFLPARYHQIRVEDLARAMRINAERPGSPGIQVLQYPEFVELLQA